MSDASERFIEVMGRHFEEEGVPRIAGRLFGQLMVMERDASLDELAESLQVSKGSVSSNARLLEEWGVAERITRPGDRRDYYRIAPDISDRASGSSSSALPMPAPPWASFRSRWALASRARFASTSWLSSPLPDCASRSRAPTGAEAGALSGAVLHGAFAAY
jgi:hypothetical protein